MSLFHGGDVANLTQQVDVTFALLADARWKKRAVEEITIGSALSAESRRSFQCADIGEVLGPLRPRRATHASLVLPLTTLPKRPLLGFDVSAPDRTVANLPPRGALADLEAQFVFALANRGGIRIEEDVRALVTKICEFSPGRWETLSPRIDVPERVQTFIQSQTGWSLKPALLRTWLDSVEPAAVTLADAIGLPQDDASSAENPALVVPLLHELLGLRPGDVLGLLTRYAAFVARCAAVGDVEPFAPHAVLAEYGRRWEVMIECTVPLSGPFIVRMSERRPLHVARRGRVDLDVTTGDALSNHTVIRVTDESVRITDQLAALAIDGSVLTDEFDSIRLTREEIATYASNPDREYRLRLRLRLAALPHIAWTTGAIALLTVFSVVLVVARWSSLTSSDLAVIVIPTTFAASLTVTRERTTLATRLTIMLRTFVLILIVVLWVLVAALYLSDT